MNYAVIEIIRDSVEGGFTGFDPLCLTDSYFIASSEFQHAEIFKVKVSAEPMIVTRVLLYKQNALKIECFTQTEVLAAIISDIAKFFKLRLLPESSLEEIINEARSQLDLSANCQVNYFKSSGLIEIIKGDRSIKYYYRNFPVKYSPVVMLLKWRKAVERTARSKGCQRKDLFKIGENDGKP